MIRFWIAECAYLPVGRDCGIKNEGENNSSFPHKRESKNWVPASVEMTNIYI